MPDEVVVVIGVGGMGRVIARRQGIGKALLLADHNEQALQAVVDELKADGHNVIGQRVDVSSRASVSGWPRPRRAWEGSLRWRTPRGFRRRSRPRPPSWQ